MFFFSRYHCGRRRKKYELVIASFGGGHLPVEETTH
jgi:hypothetical protein